MAKKTNPINLLAIEKSIKRAISPVTNHSTVIVMVATIGVLIYSILTVSSIITLQDDTAYRKEQATNRINGVFDKETIDKINNLKASSDSSSIELPQGRRNPFIN